MNTDRANTKSEAAQIHENGLISEFIILDKRSRYSEFLSHPKRRIEILRRLNHFFDFRSERSSKIERLSSKEFVRLLRLRGAGRHGYVIGGNKDGCELPLEEAIESSLESPSGSVVSCIPGKLALYLQEFPPGEAFVLDSNERGK